MSCNTCLVQQTRWEVLLLLIRSKGTKAKQTLACCMNWPNDKSVKTPHCSHPVRTPGGSGDGVEIKCPSSGWRPTVSLAMRLARMEGPLLSPTGSHTRRKFLKLCKRVEKALQLLHPTRRESELAHAPSSKSLCDGWARLLQLSPK